MNLPLDVLLAVAMHLPLADMLVLRRTSHSLHAFSHLRELWTLLFRTHVLEQGLPCPDVGPLADLDAAALEALVRRAVTLRRTWTSPQPAPVRCVRVPPTEPNARVIFLQFLPGRSHRYLVSVRMTPRPRSYRLQCWDLSPSDPTCVAELTHADGPYGGVVLNSDPTSPAVLALQSAQTETFSIRFDAQDPECAFETEATIDGIRELHLLSGSTLVTRAVDDGALSLWDLDDLAQERLQLINPSVQPEDRVQAVHLAHDYALVVRTQSIEIYSTCPRPNILAHRGPPLAYPLAQHKFQWRTDSVVLCTQHAAGSPPPIHLLVRFASIYPWPVNVLHRLALLPNPTYGRRPESPTSEYHLPYDLHPHTTHTIGSPVRLFGQASMALGPYGTALWLDHHTDALSGPSERGQRLAGTTDTTETMMFGMQNDDAWTRVAMEEEAGRIALGHVDGGITLMEY